MKNVILRLFLAGFIINNGTLLVGNITPGGEPEKGLLFPIEVTPTEAATTSIFESSPAAAVEPSIADKVVANVSRAGTVTSLVTGALGATDLVPDELNAVFYLIYLKQYLDMLHQSAPELWSKGAAGVASDVKDIASVNGARALLARAILINAFGSEDALPRISNTTINFESKTQTVSSLFTTLYGLYGVHVVLAFFIMLLNTPM